MYLSKDHMFSYPVSLGNATFGRAMFMIYLLHDDLALSNAIQTRKGRSFHIHVMSRNKNEKQKGFGGLHNTIVIRGFIPFKGAPVGF